MVGRPTCRRAGSYTDIAAAGHRVGVLFTHCAWLTKFSFLAFISRFDYITASCPALHSTELVLKAVGVPGTRAIKRHR